MWWTEELADKAYGIVKDRKFPIVIPSYNSPNPLTVRKLFSDMNDSFNYPVFIVVRDSQREEYERQNDNKYVTIVSFEDSLISNIGKTRRQIMNWLHDNGYSNAFMFDDDMKRIIISTHGLTKTGNDKAIPADGYSVSEILACWQLSMEELNSRYDKMLITGINNIAYSWLYGTINSPESVLLYSRYIRQAVCVNVDNAFKYGINYGSSDECGHEDLDIVLQALKKDMVVSTILFISYDIEDMKIDNFSEYGSTLLERLKTQQEIMIGNYGGYEYVKYGVNDKGIHFIECDFKKYRKDRGIKNHKIDIWNNGKLVGDRE